MNLILNSFPRGKMLATFCLFLSSSLAWADDDRVDFRNDVMPALTKLGCNAGSCHGAAVGRGNFKLSLYGGRPFDDFQSITRASKGRRINRFDAEKSLLLRKPGGDIDHEGQQLFDPDDPSARLLLHWIEQGASFERRQSDANENLVPTLVDLDLGERVVQYDEVGVDHPFKFFALFSDGTRRDVTEWTVLTSDDESSLSVVAATNVATVHRPGRHILVARYLNIVKSIEMIVPFHHQAAPIEWELGRNAIDDQIYRKLNQLGLPASPVVSDVGYLRRVSLDLTGRLPTLDEVDSFVADSDRDKRQGLVDRLVKTEAFNDYWAYRFSNQLRIRSQPKDSIGARTYYQWLRKQIADNRPWDEIARELLMAQGDSHGVGQANFYRTTNSARLQAEFVSEALMGVTLRCANCHNHPLDSWTQDDYHGLAAIFARTKQGRFVSSNPLGKNIHPVTGRDAIPRVPAYQDLLEPEDDYRKPFADWLLDNENPFFARAQVNRIWEALMGRGLVASVNDLRTTSPASHQELLGWLADDFIANDFDIRHTISQICRSEAYQRDRRHLSSGTENEAAYDQVFYGFSPVRSLPPEVLADAICDVTGVAESFANEPKGTRAIQLFDSRIPSRTLDVLGRCSREESCDIQTTQSGGGLSTQLHLMNGGLINQKINSNHGRLARMIADDRSTEQVVNRFYQLAFARVPSEAEASFWRERLDDDQSAEIRTAALQDFVWSLLNSQEFMTNH